jgi:hypothetical protein
VTPITIDPTQIGKFNCPPGHEGPLYRISYAPYKGERVVRRDFHLKSGRVSYFWSVLRGPFEPWNKAPKVAGWKPAILSQPKESQP